MLGSSQLPVTPAQGDRVLFCFLSLWVPHTHTPKKKNRNKLLRRLTEAGTAPAIQAQGPECGAPACMLSVVPCACKVSVVEGKTGGSLGFAGQPVLIT